MALGVPPMLLGIPGDNTYANYQEANRSFWRQTVLPLVQRTANALANWLAPAWGAARLSLKPDLDAIEALASEREALWTRLDKATFLAPNEKRAAAGYGPLDGGGDGLAAKAGFNPAQLRVPAGSPDGGQWVDGGTLHPVQSPLGSQYTVDLTEHEGVRGAHTIRGHVAKSKEYLLEGVRRARYRGPFVTIALESRGSFATIEDANNLVNRTLEHHPLTVLSVASGQLQDEFVVHRFGYITGYEAFRPHADADPYIRPTYEVGVFLVHDPQMPQGFRVHTAFPRNSRPQ